MNTNLIPVSNDRPWKLATLAMLGAVLATLCTLMSS
jgi:hypothetical protein